MYSEDAGSDNAETEQNASFQIIWNIMFSQFVLNSYQILLNEHK